jgi:hypothetical protein
MSKHLPIGTSKVSRIIKCPASLSRSDKAPEQVAGSAATEGSLLHLVMENLYDSDTSAADQIGKTKYKDLVLTAEMVAEQIDPAIAAMEKALDLVDADELVIEQFVEYIPDLCGGTLDLMALSEDKKTLLLADYKFGFNGVKAEGNNQILLAALAASVDPATSALFLKAEKFVGAIIQPKVYGDEPSVWEFTKAEVDAFEDELIEAIDSSEDETPPASSGSHCTWCPAAPYCPEKKVLARSALVLSKDNSEQLAEAMAMVDEVEAWAKAVRKAAHSALDRGGKVEGWKLVAKRASRVWADAGAVETRIRNAKKLKLTEGFEMKLKSPAKIEKLCKEKGIPFQPFADMAVMYSSGSTMAAEKDKRPAIGVKEIPDILVKMVAQS